MPTPAIRTAVATAVVALSLAACERGTESEGRGAATASVEPPSLRALRASPQVLRVRFDAARGVAWTLGADGVAVHDIATGATLRSAALPGWTRVGEAYACPPDLALGPEGHAVVSSNALLALWRIDANTLEVTRHELVADARGMDLGFTGIVYASRHRAWFAVTGVDGRLWRIDEDLTRADPVALPVPVPRACDVSVAAGTAGTALAGALCMRTEVGPWIVGPALAGRPAFARPAPCRADRDRGVGAPAPAP